MSEFLKCDAPGCDHRELVESIVASMIGKPCPVCGASLLTADDFAFYESRVKPAFELGLQIGLFQHANPGEDGAMSINWHDGELRMKRAPAQPDTDKE